MDVSESNFQSLVIDRSHAVPVVVDFWADWCGPCRALGPVLERAVSNRSPKIELAKVDVDADPVLARDHRIQGIPAVKAFRDGKVVSEFVGAQPAPAVERFLDSLLPSQADALVSEGDEQSLRQALELEPGREDAAVALARILRSRGEGDAALEVLTRTPRGFLADGLAARIALESSEGPDVDQMRSSLNQAFAALDAGDRDRALDLLIALLPSADGARDDIRRVVVGVLDELAPEDPLARDARRRLASALY